MRARAGTAWVARGFRDFGIGSRRGAASQGFRRVTEQHLRLQVRRKCCEIEEQTRRRDVGECCARLSVGQRGHVVLQALQLGFGTFDLSLQVPCALQVVFVVAALQCLGLLACLR